MHIAFIIAGGGGRGDQELRRSGAARNVLTISPAKLMHIYNSGGRRIGGGKLATVIKLSNRKLAIQTSSKVITRALTNRKSPRVNI